MPVIPPFFIREATENDSPAIAQVHLQCWNETYQGLIDQSYLDSLTFDQQLKKRQSVFNNKETTTFVAIVEGQLVGFCDVGKAETTIAGIGEIYTLYLLERHHQLGIGTQLFQSALKRLRDSGFHSFFVWVLSTNNKARLFYEKQGAVRIEEKSVLIGGKEYRDVKYILAASIK